jgi:head-tail adaptor
MGPTRKGAGERRHRVELQTAITVTDAMKGRSQQWMTYAAEYGAIDATPFVVSETQATVQYTVTIPYRSDWRDLKGRRVVVDGLTLKVLAAVKPKLVNHQLALYCGEVSGA